MPRTALATYDRLIPYADVTCVPWAALAAALRVESSIYVDGRRQERLDRAEDCDMRARRLAIRAMLTSRPDFVPMVDAAVVS